MHSLHYNAIYINTKYIKMKTQILTKLIGQDVVDAASET